MGRTIFGELGHFFCLSHPLELLLPGGGQASPAHGLGTVFPPASMLGVPAWPVVSDLGGHQQGLMTAFGLPSGQSKGLCVQLKCEHGSSLGLFP